MNSSTIFWRSVSSPLSSNVASSRGFFAILNKLQATEQKNPCQVFDWMASDFLGSRRGGDFASGRTTDYYGFEGGRMSPSTSRKTILALLLVGATAGAIGGGSLFITDHALDPTS